MVDPVILIASGISYERSAIEKWIATSRTDPITRQCIPDGSLLAPNVTLRSAIEEALGPQIMSPRTRSPMSPSQVTSSDREASVVQDLDAAGVNVDEEINMHHAVMTALRRLETYVCRRERGDPVVWAQVKAQAVGTEMAHETETTGMYDSLALRKSSPRLSCKRSGNPLLY